MSFHAIRLSCHFTARPDSRAVRDPASRYPPSRDPAWPTRNRVPEREPPPPTMKGRWGWIDGGCPVWGATRELNRSASLCQPPNFCCSVRKYSASCPALHAMVRNSAKLGWSGIRDSTVSITEHAPRSIVRHPSIMSPSMARALARTSGNTSIGVGSASPIRFPTP